MKKGSEKTKTPNSSSFAQHEKSVLAENRFFREGLAKPSIIRKAGLAVIRDRKILLLRKRGLDSLILPGGKIEPGESMVSCLERELDEELGVRLGKAEFLGSFSGVAAGSGESLVIYLYLGDFVGVPLPRAEITGMAWVDSLEKNVSPIHKEKIMPFLKARGLVD